VYYTTQYSLFHMWENFNGRKRDRFQACLPFCHFFTVKISTLNRVVSITLQGCRLLTAHFLSQTCVAAFQPWMRRTLDHLFSFSHIRVDHIIFFRSKLNSHWAVTTFSSLWKFVLDSVYVDDKKPSNSRTELIVFVSP